MTQIPSRLPSSFKVIRSGSSCTVILSMSFPDIVLLGFNVILSCSIADLILFFLRDIAARIEALSPFLCFLLRQQR